MPVAIARDKRVTLEQLRVAVCIASFRGNDDEVNPRRAALAERCGVHPANISAATTALERFGWLKKEGKGGHSKATRYVLTVPDSVAQQATVVDSATVAQSATPAVADSTTRLPIAHSATRKEENQTKKTTGTTSGASAPSAEQTIFGACVSFLTTRGRSDTAARSLLGKWRKEYGDAAVIDAVSRAEREDISEPVAWLTKYLQGSSGSRRTGEDFENRDYGQTQVLT